MPILKRADGIQFVIQTYRELLAPTKASLLKNEIRMLAQNHGEYVRLFKQPDGQYEAVFSREPGFLLGETVWKYFGNPNDLIYCEALPEGQQAIVVVVRSGTVYLDTKIPFANIPDEFSSLLAGQHQYEIYTFGDVPLSEKKQRGKFNFDSNLVKSFTHLPNSVFEQLPADESLQLQPLELVLRSIKFIKRSPVFIVLGAILAILVLGIWYQMHKTKVTPVEAQPITVTHKPVSPYQAYETALTTPDPERQIAQFAALVQSLYDLPGWQATNVTFRDSTYTIQMTSLGGSIGALYRWTENHGMRMNIGNDGAKVTIGSAIRNRTKPNSIYNLQKLTYLVIDRMYTILPQNSVTIGATSPVGQAKSTQLNIRFTQMTPSTLNLLGKQLAGLPIRLNSLQANINEGLLTGIIQITVLGN